MTHPVDLNQIEDRYSSLRDALHGLSHLMVHGKDENRLLEAFRQCGRQAVELFHSEEEAMAKTGCPALEPNRAGHRKFLDDLGVVLRHAREEGAGIHAASLLRRELLPWFHEHHAVVDRQIVHHLRRRTSAMAQRHS